MAQIVNIADLPNACRQPDASLEEAADTARIDMRVVFGRDISLAVATCAPGYHPAPQVHASEQLNYVAEGEIWIFADGEAYLLRAGDALRVPAMKIHWMWNRSANPCVLYESHCPPLAGDPAVRNSEGALFDDASIPAGLQLPAISWLAESYARELEQRDPQPSAGPLFAAAGSLQTSVHGGAIGAAAAGKLTTKCIHGLRHNMTVARRRGGYHSMPHMHEAEQIHHVVQGEISIFTPEAGFLCRRGDFNIVPSGVPHWSIVPDGEDNILLQAHSPVLGSAANRKALLTAAEAAVPPPVVYNLAPWRAEDLWALEESHLAAMRTSRRPGEGE